MKMKEKNIYELELHEETGISKYFYATRVPGGWIYSSYNGSSDMQFQVFVPFNNEFQNQNEIFKGTLEQLDGLTIRGEK